MARDLCVAIQVELPIFTGQRDRGDLGARRQLIDGEHFLIADNHAFVGKQPSPQPKFERAGLLFLQRVEEDVPGNQWDIHCSAPFLCSTVNEFFCRELRDELSKSSVNKFVCRSACKAWLAVVFFSRALF